jgi:multidrug efflux pump subunit AcrA (membrane-fusion protein)
VEDRRTAITKPLNQALKQVNDLFRGPREFLVEAEKRLKDSILLYTRRQEQLAAAARALAEQEMQAQQAALSAEQQDHAQAAEEAEQSAEKAWREAQEATSRGDLQAAETARHEARAQLAVAEQSRVRGSEVNELAQVLSMPGALAAAPRLDGVSGRTSYAAVVTDFMALVGAVASGLAPAECLQPDHKFLTSQARAFRRTGPLYPGVEATAQKNLAVRLDGPRFNL